MTTKKVSKNLDEKNLKALEEAKQKAEEEALAAFPADLMQKVNMSIEVGAAEVEKSLQETQEEFAKRDKMYVIRGLLLQCFKMLETDPDSPYKKLSDEIRDLERQVNATSRTVDGMKVGMVPFGSQLRHTIDGLKRQLGKMKNDAAEAICAEYDTTADEVFAFAREEQKLYDAQGKDNGKDK